MSAPLFILIALFGLFGASCCIVAIAVLIVELVEHHRQEQVGEQLAAEAQEWLAAR